jgi:hexosaminidase
MTSLSITPKFNTKNLLEILIKNNSDQIISSFKVCFSLVYSIKSLEGAQINKQTGRYYELRTDDPHLPANGSLIITLALQIPRIGTYNMSCGPEGIFVIDKNNKIIQSSIDKLTFETEISKVIYPTKKENTSMPVIPEPKIRKMKNDFINCNNSFHIIDQKLLEIVNVLKRSCQKLQIDFNSKQGRQIHYKEAKLELEEYKIEILKDKIIITAFDYSGRLYALISLIHLIFCYRNKLPLGLIQDKPQFYWRGMHLDCARQFHSVNQIKRLLDYMVFFKLNRFHWHLTDNEAWRLDLKSFPSLAKQTSFRGYHEIIPPVYGTGYHRSGGFYSLKDVKEIIEYAKKLNIEIMPEIDLPAHSWALTQVMPNLYDTKSNNIFQDVGNYQNNTINPSLEATWNFLESVLKDIAEMFSYSLIHIGVDERPKNSWDNSPELIEFMKKNKYQSFDEVQDYFVNRIIKILKNFNKRTAAWNEAALPPHNDIGSAGSAGNVDKNCLIFAWEHTSVVEKVLKKGFETVMCPGQLCYFDMAYNNSTYERGICWAATIETSDIHAWKPLNNIEPKYHSLVAGIQGQLWSETLTEKGYIDLMINPRLATLAEVAWSPNNRRNWSNFRAALFQSMQLTDKLGWNYHDF